jgi:hypothetical protein
MWGTHFGIHVLKIDKYPIYPQETILHFAERRGILVVVSSSIDDLLSAFGTFSVFFRPGILVWQEDECSTYTELVKGS